MAFTKPVTKISLEVLSMAGTSHTIADTDTTAWGTYSYNAFMAGQPLAYESAEGVMRYMPYHAVAGIVVTKETTTVTVTDANCEE